MALLAHQIHAALQRLTPAAEYTIEGDGLENIVWLDGSQTRPDDADISSEAALAAADWNEQEYLRLRVLEYQQQGVTPMDLVLALYASEFDGETAAATELETVRDSINVQCPPPA